jgi:putative SOS response-associated peptidase YedK
MTKNGVVKGDQGMCDRYRLEPDWSEFPMFRVPPDFEPKADVRPTNTVPVIRLVNGAWQTEMRSWGFVRVTPGRTKKRLAHILFNAVGEGLAAQRPFKKAFADNRCLIPMSSWYAWPKAGGLKKWVELEVNGRKIFLAAGLFETSKDAVTGKPVETFTMVTLPERELPGTIPERAPLVLRNQDLMAWCEEGTVGAQSLISVNPDRAAFCIRPD